MHFTKNKFITLVVLLVLALSAKYIFFNYPISAGKRVGNLTKLSLRGKILKTWEGTLNEGYGDKLTTYFSISDSKIADELYIHEGKEVIIYYEEYLVGWPRETIYNAVKWEPVQSEESKNENESTTAQVLSKTLFCSLLGTLRTNEELYQKVKNQVEANNYYLFKQIQECND